MDARVKFPDTMEKCYSAGCLTRQIWCRSVRRSRREALSPFDSQLLSVMPRKWVTQVVHNTQCDLRHSMAGRGQHSAIDLNAFSLLSLADENERNPRVLLAKQTEHQAQITARQPIAVKPKQKKKPVTRSVGAALHGQTCAAGHAHITCWFAGQQWQDAACCLPNPLHTRGSTTAGSSMAGARCNGGDAGGWGDPLGGRPGSWGAGVAGLGGNDGGVAEQWVQLREDREHTGVEEEWIFPTEQGAASLSQSPTAAGRGSLPLEYQLLDPGFIAEQRRLWEQGAARSALPPAAAAAGASDPASPPTDGQLFGAEFLAEQQRLWQQLQAGQVGAAAAAASPPRRAPAGVWGASAAASPPTRVMAPQAAGRSQLRTATAAPASPSWQAGLADGWGAPLAGVDLPGRQAGVAAAHAAAAEQLAGSWPEEDAGLAAFPPALIRQQQQLWEQLHSQQLGSSPTSSAQPRPEWRAVAAGALNSGGPLGSPAPRSPARGSRQHSAAGSPVAARAGSGTPSALQQLGDFPALPPAALPGGSPAARALPHPGIATPGAGAGFTPVRRRGSGAGRGPASPVQPSVRVLRAAAPMPWELEAATDPEGAFFTLPRPSKADLEWDLRMEGMCHLDEAVAVADAEADFAARERTLLAIAAAAAAEDEEAAVRGGGGAGGGGGTSADALWEMMDRTGRRQGGGQSDDGDGTGVALVASAGALGSDWRRLKQWMADNG